MILKVVGAESFPAKPTPIKATPRVGRVASVLLISATAESFSASGVNLTLSGDDCPGVRLKAFGVMVKTEARD